MGKWETFPSSLGSHNLFIDFLNVSVLSDTVVYSAIPYEKIKAYMFLRRSLASLARAYKLHVYVFFYYVGTYIWGLASPPPSPIPKSWLRYCCQLSLTRRVAKWRWPIPSPPPPPPPTRYTKSPPLLIGVSALRLHFWTPKWRSNICQNISLMLVLLLTAYFAHWAWALHGVLSYFCYCYCGFPETLLSNIK